jgi:polysaccharide pyruvyl transferase CsaB
VADRGASARVLLCGYYGEHNLGDDALLQVLLAQLPPGWDPVVTARDEPEVRRRWNVETVDRSRPAAVLTALRRCDALVFGGGSLLQDATSFRSLLYYVALILAARLRRLPVLLWGQGLGPLRRRRSRTLVRTVLPLATAISWRDPASAAQAARWGVAGLEGSDPVWALEGPRIGSWRGQGGPIVLCWRPVPRLGDDDWRRLLAWLGQLARQSGRELVWLPFHRDQDAPLEADLQARGVMPPDLLRISRLQPVQDPDEALAVFATAGLVLAMRLHGLILAALTGAPCAALSYDPKVAAAAAQLGCPCLDLLRPPAPGGTPAADWVAQLDRPVAAAVLEPLRRRAQLHRRLLEEGLGGGARRS